MLKLRRILHGLSQVLSRSLPEPYRSRAPTEPVWVERFGERDRLAIRQFLEICCGAYMLRHTEAAHIHPDDRPMEIYKAALGWWHTDSMEIETLAIELKERFGLYLADGDFGTLTLGEIYARARDVHRMPPAQ